MGNLPPESSAAPELPSFFDRLPDLGLALRTAASGLEQAGPSQSYLPYWEDLYAAAHSLKGVLSLLACPPVLANFLLAFNEVLLAGLAGPLICRKPREAAAAFRTLGRLLDELQRRDAEREPLGTWLTGFRQLYNIDLMHEERLQEVPAHLVYVSEFVSKKAREVTLLQLNYCVAEDEILLDEIPLWRTQLNEALTHPDFGRGLVVNFLPFISPAGSQKLKVWAWVAAATPTRAALKARIKEVLPRVQLTKL